MDTSDVLDYWKIGFWDIGVLSLMPADTGTTSFNQVINF